MNKKSTNGTGALRKWLASLSVGVSFLAVMSCASVKEFEQTACLSGRISDEYGNAVSEYRLECDGVAVLTGKNGIFVFPEVKAGKYRLRGGKNGWTSIDEEITFVDRRKLICVTVHSIGTVYEKVENLLSKNEAEKAVSLLELHKKENEGDPVFEFYRYLTSYCESKSPKKLSRLQKHMQKNGVEVALKDENSEDSKTGGNVKCTEGEKADEM